jgi:hypothetical protein
MASTLGTSGESSHLTASASRLTAAAALRRCRATSAPVGCSSDWITCMGCSLGVSRVRQHGDWLWDCGSSCPLATAHRAGATTGARQGEELHAK